MPQQQKRKSEEETPPGKPKLRAIDADADPERRQRRAMVEQGQYVDRDLRPAPARRGYQTR